MILSLSILAALLALTLYREREIRHERERWETERRSLLDRIQYPEVRQIESLPPEMHETPTDAAFFAAVGHIDPDLPPED